MPTATAFPLSTPSGERGARLTAAEIALFGMLGALTFGAKVVMSPLPNIEPASLMIMLFAVTFGRRAVFPIYTYVALELLVYGVSLWSIPYLYIWLALAGAAWLMRGADHPLAWALLSGVYGLLFGALCAPVTLVLSGPVAALTWWISGIPYDLLHFAGNFVLALVLFRPLRRLLGRLYGAMRQRA